VEIQVENESQWNTDDLRALVAKVLTNHAVDIEGLCKDARLLIFKTSRRKSYRSDRDKPPVEAAHRGYASIRGSRCVEIYSKEKLIEKNTLERLAAAAGAEIPQDLKPKYIRDIAKAIMAALTDNYSVKDDKDQFKWAETCQLRSAPKITRSPVVLQKKIEARVVEKRRVTRIFECELQKIDQRIKALHDKLPNTGN
jgi:hypothetical protein